MLDGMRLVKEQNTLKENNFIKPMTMNNEYMSKIGENKEDNLNQDFFSKSTEYIYIFDYLSI